VASRLRSPMRMTAQKLAGAAFVRRLEEYFSERQGRDVHVLDVEPLGSDADKGLGYGVPHRVTLDRGEPRSLVVHRSTVAGYGHDRPSDRAAMALLAWETFNGFPRHVRALDVGVVDERGEMRSLADARDYYLVTEWGEGTPYADDLRAIAERGDLSARDLARVDALADVLSRAHRDEVGNEELWRRRTRDVFGGHEGIAGVIDGYEGHSLEGFTSREDLMRIEQQCVALRHRTKALRGRLRRVHGDFHPWNILFGEGDVPVLLDRSRGEWGDPADDIAALTMNYVFFALRRSGTFDGPFATLWTRFYERYLEQRPDAELGLALPAHLVWRALVVASPAWYPHIELEVRRALFGFIDGLLREERFDHREVGRLVSSVQRA
jgi:hypothetical protein